MSLVRIAARLPLRTCLQTVNATCERQVQKQDTFEGITVFGTSFPWTCATFTLFENDFPVAPYRKKPFMTLTKHVHSCFQGCSMHTFGMKRRDSELAAMGEQF